ncbi:sulfatase [Chryseolinea sp. T2]|uniref:sulfatase n=1 Tax=Chryseolinea sp. T2 TaxID=3129255 RepID=UPI0030775E85
MTIKRILSTLLAVAVTATVSIAQVKKPTASKPPNIVFFLVDDLGWRDVGCFGSEFYETPNIDKLAKNGVKFTNSYSACHVCSPTRASLLSGKYPARINLTDWLPGRNDFAYQKLQNVEVNQQIPYEETTLAEALKAKGYSTAIVGKWHLGEAPSDPTKHGFDMHIPAGWSKGWPLAYDAPFKLPNYDGKPGEYLTDRLTTDALQYIEDHRDQPFFLYFSHFAVHDPIEGRKDLVEKYKKKLAAKSADKRPPYILEGNPDSDPLTIEERVTLLTDSAYKGFSQLPRGTVKVKQRQDNVQFAAMVEAMDESLGRVMEKLKQLGIEENTIVVFVSDNGGMSAGNFGRPSKVLDPRTPDKHFSTSNLPLRGAKGWMYEGGIRVPMIVKWSGVKSPGSTCTVPVVSMDFFPSLLDMAGLPLLPQQHVDGVSIKPLLQGKKKLEREAIYWHFPHYSNHGMQSPGGAVRAGKYKLIEYYENGTVQLYDLEKDLGELNDISKQNPAKTKELTAMLHAWRQSVGAKMMAPNPDYVAGREPWKGFKYDIPAGAKSGNH